MKAPKGHDRRIASYFMESSAQKVVALLKEYGIRASYRQRSRSINEEPFVEHKFDVIVGYVHIQEWQCAERVLKGKVTV